MAMSKDRNALKSGLFILVTIVAIIGVIVGIKGLSTWSEPKELRAAFFQIGRMNGPSLRKR